MGLHWPKLTGGNPIKRIGNAYVQGYKTYLTGTTNKKQQDKRIAIGASVGLAYVTLGASGALQAAAQQRSASRVNPSPGEYPVNPNDTYADPPPDSHTSIYGGNPLTTKSAQSQAAYQQQHKKTAAAGGLLIVGALGLVLLIAMVKK